MRVHTKLRVGVVLGLAAASLSSTLLAAGPLSLGRLAIPERLSASQVALAAIAVGNGGRSSVLLTGAQLSFAGPGVVATVRTAFPRPLSAASTTVLTFTVATGEWIFQKNLNASVRVTGVDTLTAQPVEVLAQWTAGSTLQTRPDLAIVGLGAKSLSVVRGQPFHAEVRIVNRGEAAVRVLSAAPRFDDPSAGAEVLTTWAEIPGNGGQHGFALTGRAAGSGGVTRLVSATVEAFDVNGGGRVPIRANLAAPLTLVARPRPELEILAIEVSRERLAPGETLQARVVFRVSSDGPLDLSTAELSFFPPLVTAAATGSLRSVEPFSPSTTLTFTVRAGTRPGKVRFTGLNLIATERATGQPLGKIVNRAPRQPEVIVE